MAKMPEEQLKKNDSVLAFIGDQLDGIIQETKKSKKTGMPEERAKLDQDFQARKQAAFSQLQSWGIKPEMVQQYMNMTPEQLEAAYNRTKHMREVAKDAIDIKLKQSKITGSLYGKAGQISNMIDALQEELEETDNPPTPERAAILKDQIKNLTAQQGGSKITSLQGRPEADISDQEKRLAVGQWVQNPSSLRGLDKTVQQNVIKWASTMGITPQDVIDGQAERKFAASEASAAGRRSGTLKVTEQAMPGLISTAEEASKAVPRGSFVPINKLVQYADTQLSDPSLRSFKLANQALASEYQQIISRGGPNVTALKLAMEALKT